MIVCGARPEVGGAELDGAAEPQAPVSAAAHAHASAQRAIPSWVFERMAMAAPGSAAMRYYGPGPGGDGAIETS
jgi:hypothetical protein